jgi:hypothetical protein
MTDKKPDDELTEAESTKARFAIAPGDLEFFNFEGEEDLTTPEQREKNKRHAEALAAARGTPDDDDELPDDAGADE